MVLGGTRVRAGVRVRALGATLADGPDGGGPHGARPDPGGPAAPCDAPVLSPVACENTKPGSPESEWGISGAGSSSIQGFATDISVDQGGTIGFKVDTPASSYRLDIYRMGYYGGMGARKVATLSPSGTATSPTA